MPELPEVETTKRGLSPHLQDKIISDVIVRQSQLRWPVPESLPQLLAGQIIRQLSRRGKYLLFNLSAGTLLVHLGMSGNLRLLPAIAAPNKHDHIDFILTEGQILRFNDPRRFGAVLWTSAPAYEHPLLKDLGPEPLLPEFNGALLYQLSRQRKTPVKAFIMNSHTVVGVGNIYANEALFMAGIHPARPAGRISLSCYENLANCIRAVLLSAIEQGGTTLRDFVNEKGKPGYFQQQLRVYGRSGLPCTNCQQPLKEMRLSNRSSVYCSYCQR